MGTNRDTGAGAQRRQNGLQGLLAPGPQEAQLWPSVASWAPYPKGEANYLASSTFNPRWKCPSMGKAGGHWPHWLCVECLSCPGWAGE